MLQCNQTYQERKLNMYKQQDRLNFNFQFPPKIFQTYKFKTPNELSQNLTRLGVKMCFYKGRVFDRHEYQYFSSTKLLFTCKTKSCPSKLLYLHNPPDTMIPLYFHNEHRHKKNPDPTQSKKQQITNFILNLRGEEYEQYQKVPKWTQRFDVNGQEGLYIIEQVYWYNNSEDQLLGRLAQEGKIVRRVRVGGSERNKEEMGEGTREDEDQNGVIFVARQTMVQGFGRFGETITVQIYYQKGKKRPSFGQKYAIGYFFCQDDSMRLVLVGTFIITKQTKQVYKQLFKIFFETVCRNKPPYCIFTDIIPAITQALSQLKTQHNYKYFNLHPWYHMTGHIRSILKQQEGLKKQQGKEGQNGHGNGNGKLIMDLMCRAMLQNSQRQYCLLMGELKTRLKGFGCEHIWSYFLQMESKCCYRRIARIFSGFGITTKFGDVVLKLVNNSAIYRAHSGRLFHRLLKIQTHLRLQAEKNVRFSQVLLKYCPIQINNIYPLVQPFIMQTLLKFHSQSQQLTKNRQDILTFKLSQKSPQPQPKPQLKPQPKQYECKFSLQFDHWQCQCLQLEIMGLPCPHLISVLLDQSVKGDLRYYVNPRWMQAEDKKRKRKMGENVRGPFITNKKRVHR